MTQSVLVMSALVQPECPIILRDGFLAGSCTRASSVSSSRVYMRELNSQHAPLTSHLSLHTGDIIHTYTGKRHSFYMSYQRLNHWH